MRTQRQSVDYSLQRRALLREVYSNRVGTYEVCDASPYLKSAARFHGDQTDERCPICRRENLTHVNYIYGDELKTSAGQARSRAELPTLAMTLREFKVYVVEVCRGCGWNHLVEQYVLGRDGLVDSDGDAASAAASSVPATASHRSAPPPAATSRSSSPVAPSSGATTTGPRGRVRRPDPR